MPLFLALILVLAAGSAMSVQTVLGGPPSAAPTTAPANTVLGGPPS
ncbi:MAG: hypothetical protein QOI11_1225 [Candidatus Eremiobacteraeota bacterium]|jgi:hypothetical protein|nr:hypothetical protein [Candidatus Eremiobacteraeota bacterium]